MDRKIDKIDAMRYGLYYSYLKDGNKRVTVKRESKRDDVFKKILDESIKILGEKDD